MRLATYNLLHGVPVLGATAGARPSNPADLPVPGVEPLIESIRRLAPDVVGLQEVDRHQPRSGGHDQVQVVAAAMGAHYSRFVPSVTGTPGSRDSFTPASEDVSAAVAAGHDVGPVYGVGLVSRWPVTAWHQTVFPAAPLSLPLLIPASPKPIWMRIPDEPRAAIAAVIDGPYGQMTVATAHLSFVPGVNVRQLRALRTWLRDLPRPLFLLGDFNLIGRVPAWTTGWMSLATVATYPTMSPRVQFDHALADGISPDVRAGAHAEAIALPVSDHCALAVDLTVGW